MNVIPIKSLDIPELDVFMRLTEAQLRNRLEPEKGIFIAESLKVVRTAIECGITPIAFLSEEKHIEGALRKLLEQGSINPDTPIYTASRETISQLTGYELSRGFVCAMRRPALPKMEEICRDSRRIAIMDSVVNSTNTGAIFRAAAALGIDGLLLTPTCCDPLNRRSVRVSMGTVFQLPWTYISGWPTAGINRLHDMGFTIAALALSDKAVDIDKSGLDKSEKLALVMGTEGDGLSTEVTTACDHVVRIPMRHGVDSLNVAAAAAVAFWELG